MKQNAPVHPTFDAPWGFTPEAWMLYSYLWRVDDEVYLAFVEARERGMGALRTLIHGIEHEHLHVAVPTPLPLMRRILEHYGFERTVEHGGEFGPIDVWRRPCKEAP